MQCFGRLADCDGHFFVAGEVSHVKLLELFHLKYVNVYLVEQCFLLQKQGPEAESYQESDCIHL